LLLSITISFGFIQIAGNLTFNKLKSRTLKKAQLFTHAIIPLAFAFEFVYQLNPLLTRLGTFFPVLGRQFNINLDFFSAAASPGIVRFWQVAFLVGGMALSYLFLHILKKKHQEEKVGGLFSSSLQWLPIMFWGMIYIKIFL
jgi:hypothetical protein